MKNTATYEYRIAMADDNAEQVNELMAAWADAGWELVSGSASAWITGHDPLHTRFVMYWRKAKASKPTAGLVSDTDPGSDA